MSDGKQLMLFEMDEPIQQDLFEWAEEEKPGNLIDITYELRIRELSRELVLDLGIVLPEDVGSVQFAESLLEIFDNQEPGTTTLVEDYPELFQLLRARVGR